MDQKKNGQDRGERNCCRQDLGLVSKQGRLLLSQGYEHQGNRWWVCGWPPCCKAWISPAYEALQTLTTWGAVRSVATHWTRPGPISSTRPPSAAKPPWLASPQHPLLPIVVSFIDSQPRLWIGCWKFLQNHNWYTQNPRSHLVILRIFNLLHWNTRGYVVSSVVGSNLFLTSFNLLHDGCNFFLLAKGVKTEIDGHVRGTWPVDITEVDWRLSPLRLQFLMV